MVASHVLEMCTPRDRKNVRVSCFCKFAPSPGHLQKATPEITARYHLRILNLSLVIDDSAYYTSSIDSDSDSDTDYDSARDDVE